MHRYRSQFSGNTSAHYYQSHFYQSRSRSRSRNQSRAVETHHYVATKENNRWLFRVTLVVLLDFCPKILEGGRDLQIMVLLKKECSFSGADSMG